MRDEDRRYNKWPVVGVGDEERDALQQGRPIYLDKAATLGDLFEACDDLGIEWEELDFEPADFHGTVCIKVSASEFGYLTLD